MTTIDAAAGPAALPAARRAGALALLGLSAAPIVAGLVLAFRDGGYFVTSWGVAAVVLWGLVAAAAIARPLAPVGTAGAVAVAGWLCLGVWQGISAAWADEPAAATAAMNQTLLYAAAFALVLIAADGAATLHRLLELALAGAVVVTAAALCARLLPAIGAEEVRSRLSTPISYWNNLALVFAFGFVLALGLASDASRHRAVRAAAAASMPAFPLGILFAQSRGALAVMVVGSLALLGLARGRLLTLAMLVVGLASSLVLMIYANGQTALQTQHVLKVDHAAAGRRVVVVLIVAAAACALAGAGVDLIDRVLVTPRRRRAAGAGAAGVALVGAVAALALAWPSGGPLHWAHSQFESFKTYDPGARENASTVADRLAVAAGTGRWQNWSVAADEFKDAPLAGTGAGDFRFRWASQRTIDLDVRNAHSLYLEVLGESGLIGLGLLLIPLAAVGVAVARALHRRPPLPLARDLALASAAGLVVALQMAGDWSWQMPAVVLPAVALGAAALKAAAVHCGDRLRAPAWLGWPVAAVAVVAFVLVAGPTAGADRAATARDLAIAGRLDAALRAADQAAALDPQSPDIALLKANILDDLGRDRQADGAFAAAVARSPHDWVVRGQWASALLRRGDRRAARILVESMGPLNPKDEQLAELRRAVAG